MNFNIKRTKIYQAVRWERISFFRFADTLKKILAVFFVLTLLLFIYGFVPGNFSEETNRSLLGVSIILLVSFFSVCIKSSFFENKFKKPELKTTLQEAVLNKEKYNLAEFLSFESAKAVNKASRGRPLSSTCQR